MNRPIPLWFFLFCILLLGLFTIVFGWSVKSTLSGSNRSGVFGKTAVEISSFPNTVKEVLGELLSYASGSYVDKSISVAREADDDYTDFAPISTSEGINIDSLIVKATPEKMARGWRFLIGAFSLDGEVENSAVLIDPDLTVVKSWKLDEVPVGDSQPRPKYRKFVHGFEALPDGSILFTFDGSISLQKFDACGIRQWSTAGDFHHAITLSDDNKSVWTFTDRETIAQVSTSNGEILRKITMDEVIENNLDIDLLEIRRLHNNELGVNARNTEGKWLEDRFHLNDVDPLPASIANRFDCCQAGDLLISARSLNLLFVIDPDTKKIKWWRAGAVQRQHDPDWLPSGAVSVLNNRMSRDYSEITKIDLESFERSSLYDGLQGDFYTRIRGKHQVLSQGNIDITSPQQGRAFEVTTSGEIVFEVYNVKPESDDTNYVISEMKWYPPEYFDLENMKCR
jgi:hypothetical protein